MLLISSVIYEEKPNDTTWFMLSGLSQEAFAEKCGMHRTYISAIECFRRSISLENIQRIADALGVEPYKLFLISEEDA